jgi:hypothetical protein
VGPGIVGDGNEVLFSPLDLPGPPAREQGGESSFDDHDSVEQVLALLVGQRDIIGQDEVADAAAVVRPLGTVNEGRSKAIFLTSSFTAALATTPDRQGKLSSTVSVRARRRGYPEQLRG